MLNKEIKNAFLIVELDNGDFHQALIKSDSLMKLLDTIEKEDGFIKLLQDNISLETK